MEIWFCPKQKIIFLKEKSQNEFDDGNVVPLCEKGYENLKAQNHDKEFSVKLEEDFSFYSSYSKAG